MSDKNKFGYATKTTTAICYEKPSIENPFVAEKMFLHGYDLIELIKNKSFVDILLLLNTGEMPSADSVQLMNALMAGLINLGPRNPGIRAAMTAGISKTRPSHLLPIGLMVSGGTHCGATSVELSMNFIKKNSQMQPEAFLLQTKELPKSGQSDFSGYPGIGSIFSSRDKVTCDIAQHISRLPAVGKNFRWLEKLIKTLNDKNIDWLPGGLAAAVLLDLGISPREGIGLFQLICAPGIIAHGFEQTHKPVSSMPFLEDNQYDYRK